MITVWNRKKKHREVEQVYGGWILHFLYGTVFGLKIVDWVMVHPFLSRIYGIYQSSKLSRFKINRFIQMYRISMDEFEIEPFQTFNHFFIRKFKQGKRRFVQSAQALGAPAEGRYFAFESHKMVEEFWVKGVAISPAELIHDSSMFSLFEDGPVLIARLCPTDYHRFHFPDDGFVLKKYSISGRLHSVNPFALKSRPKTLYSNERHVTLLKTSNFGLIAYIEVGAMCVGRIVQTHLDEFSKGDEKGYFLFGASTVILLGQKRRWKPDQDILNQTQLGFETYIQLGDSVGTCIDS